MQLRIIVVAFAFLGGCKAAQGGGGGEDTATIAKTILGDKGSASTVTAVRATLADLDAALTEAAQGDFKPSAPLDKRLSDIAQKLDINFALIARARPLATEAAEQIVMFYAGVAELRSMLGAHVKASMADDAMLAGAAKAAGAAKIEQGPLAGLSRYAIVIAPDARSPGEDQPVGAKLVEIGPPFCGGDAKPTFSGTCPEGSAPTAYGYRSDPGAAWTKGELAHDTVDSVPAKQIVMLRPSAIGDSLVKGAGGVASELMYRIRLRAITDRLRGKAGTGGVLDDGGRLEATLAREAHRPS